MIRPTRLSTCLVTTLCLGACTMPAGRSDSDAIAGFEAGAEVTVTADVGWVTTDGEFMLLVNGRPTPVYTGLLRQPVGPGQTVKVEGWTEDGGRGRILAKRVTRPDGMQVFP